MLSLSVARPAHAGPGIASRSRCLSSRSSLPLCGRGLGIAFSGFTSRQRRGVVGVVAKKQTFKSFDDMIANSDKPVLVDFYALWCGPCLMMSQTLASVAGQLKDDVLLVKIDTEKYPAIASRFKVEGLPTLAVFHEGECIARIEGALPQGDLLRWVGEVTASCGRK